MSRRGLVLIAFCLPAAIMTAQQYSIVTIAGKERRAAGLAATQVTLGSPSQVVTDRNGNIFVADTQEYRIRKIDKQGAISVYAGTGWKGSSGDSGPATAADIGYVEAMAVDQAGNVYLADDGVWGVRKIDVNGRITTLVTEQQLMTAMSQGQDTLSIAGATALTVAPSGTLYVGAYGYGRAYEFVGSTAYFVPSVYILAVDTAGRVTTVGGGLRGSSGDGGIASSLRAGNIAALAADASGNLYFTDNDYCRVRKLDKTGILGPVAGTGVCSSGPDGGPAATTPLNPAGLTVDTEGNVFVSEPQSHRVRRIDAKTGVITTYAGKGIKGLGPEGGPAAGTMLATPRGLAMDATGGLLLADEANQRVRRIGLDGTIRTLAGAAAGDGGPATEAFLGGPAGVAVDEGGTVYIADTGNNKIRAVKTAGEISALVGNGYAGYSSSAMKATEAAIAWPEALTVDSKGNAYFSANRDYRLLRVTPTGVMSTVAGTGTKGLSGDGGPATQARIGMIGGVAVDKSDNIYFTDSTNNVVRMVAAGGTITTVAGNGKAVHAGDGGPATAAQLVPLDICVDKNKNLYVSDPINARIRKIDGTGTITTYAGTGSSGYSGEGVDAKTARLSAPAGLAMDEAGNLYIADFGNARVRRVSATGVITTIAGTGNDQFAGDRTLALKADLDPYRLAVDGKGNVYVSDSYNDRVRRLTPNVPAALAAVGGGAQTGGPAEKLPSPLTVTVADANGVPVAGATVVFTVASGKATLSSDKAVTDATGTAAVTVTLGEEAGEVMITAAVNGAPAATFRLTVKIPTPVPEIRAEGVFGAGLSVPPVRALSPGGLLVAEGRNLAAAGVERKVTETDLVEGALPTALSGTCVFVNGTAAPLVEVRPERVVFQSPALAGVDRAEVRVGVLCGTNEEIRSAPQAIAYAAAAPEFVYYATTAEGVNPIKAVNLSTGAKVGVPGLLPEGEFAPAKPGEFVMLEAIGFGATDPPYTVGSFAAERAPVAGSVEVRIGRTALSAADIQYAGLSPRNPGVYLLELRIPDEVADGDQPVVVSVNGISSPGGGFIRVQREAQIGGQGARATGARPRRR